MTEMGRALLWRVAIAAMATGAIGWALVDQAQTQTQTDAPTQTQTSAAPAPAATSAPEPDGPAALCGDPRLRGRPHPAISEPVSETDPRRCGAAELVEIAAVGDVAITPPAVMTCAVAGATADWITASAAPAARDILGDALTGLRNVSAYACRTRGRSAGGKLSEHAKANALDVAAFFLAGGGRVSVLTDWAAKPAPDRPEPLEATDGDAQGAPAAEQPAEAAPGGAPPPAAQFLRRIWREACGPFGTVLGPEADAAHRDHFHFDAAERRAPYCR